MASFDQVREIVRARPFTPFSIRLMDGRRLAVSHPESIAVGPPGMDLLHYASDGAWHYIDVPNIVSIEMGPQSAAPTTGNGANT